MNTDQITDFGRRTAAAIARGDLLRALADLRQLSETLMQWETTAAIDRIADSYRYLLDYFARGAADPRRDDMLATLRADARAICDTLVRHAHMAENPDLYYSTARTLAHRPAPPVAHLIADYRAEERRLNADYTTIADPARRTRAEQLLSDIFARVWVTHPLGPDNRRAIADLAADTTLRPIAAPMTVSALTLGLLQCYDPARLALLIDIYLTAAETETALRALAGLAIALFRYRRRPIPPDVAQRLQAARDTDRWATDFADLATELLRARDTDRITAKMRDELYPGLMKLQDDLRDKIDRGDLDLGALAADGNPEWDDMLSRDGLGDKLREMSEIQADGGDVFLAAFSHLKQFPFFRDISHWFLPYHDDHTAVAALDGLDGQLGTLLRRMPLLCDSDKYSVVLSIAQMPDQQRHSAFGAMRAQSDQAAEMLDNLHAGDPRAARRDILNKYIQNLYRFHTLFRRKGEFFDPFAAGIDIFDLAPLADGFDDTDTLRTAGEFALRHRLWTEAARLLEHVDRLSDPDARRAQQIGYCYESLGDTDRAISRYDEAELLDPASRWTLRRLAAAWRRKGRPDKALPYYRRLADSLPDDFRTTLNLAFALTEAGRYDDALQQFHKAAYYDPDSLQALRGLAWTQYITRRLDRAAESYRRIIDTDPRPADYLNAGHVARALGDTPAAIDRYTSYMRAADITPDRLLADLDRDAQWLDNPADNILYVQAITSRQ